MKIILASASPRRKKLLSFLIDDFQIIPGNLNEKLLAKLARTPEELVVGLAKAKAKEVFKKIKSQKKRQENLIIIAADLTVVIDHDNTWEALGKPETKAEAKKMLKKLRNRQHWLYCGLCVLQAWPNMKTAVLSIFKEKTGFEISQVTFNNYSDREIDQYIATGKPMDKAGAYGIQDIKDRFAIKIEGNITNILGLPLELLAKILKQFGVKVKLDWKAKVKKYLNDEK